MPREELSCERRGMKEFNSLAGFKRAVESGEYIEGGYYPLKHEGWRKLLKRQTNGVWVETERESGEKYGSFLEYPKAKDVEIEQTAEGSVLYIFQDMAKVHGKDYPASAAKHDIEIGLYPETDVAYWRKRVAEYRVKGNEGRTKWD